MGNKADGKVIISTALDNSKIPAGIKGIKGALGGLNNVLKGVAGSIAAAFSVAAIVNFAKSCIELGSDLQEVQNVVDVSFGEMSDIVEEFANNAITQFGMSQLAAKRTASTYMSMAKGMGVAEDAAADMSLTLTGLSGDVASFYNLDQETAAKKLQGVFTGESEALKELGVVMTQTNLKQYALEHGMNANIETMSQAEQVALRYAFVTDALSLAAGDFTRTQDSWANQTKILSMQFEQLKATIGQGLINALTPVVKVINTIIAGLQTVARVFQQFTALLFGDAGGGGSVGETAEALEGVADGYGSAAEGAENLADATEKAGKAAKRYLANFDEIQKIGDSSGGGGSSSSLGAVGGAGTGVNIGSNVDIKDSISPKVEALVSKIQQLLAPLREIDFTPLRESLSGLGMSFADLGAVIGDALEWAWFNILVPLSTWTIEELAPATVDTLTAAFQLLSEALDPVLRGLQDFLTILQPVFSFIGDTVLLLLEEWQELFADLAKLYEEKGPKIQGIISGIGEILAFAWKTIEPILTKMRDGWDILFTYWGDIAETKLGGIIDGLHGAIEIIAGLISGDWSRVWGGIVEIIKANVNSAIGFLNAMINAIVSGLNLMIKSVNKLSIKVPDWVPGIGGSTFGFKIPTIKAPQIPYLAQGAVLPANKPFLAMVGDQKHGTNVEAPLATIQEAVALVMDDYVASNIAGHEATVAVLRDILQAVLGIEIGDAVIGQAVARYNAKMAIVRGNA